MNKLLLPAATSSLRERLIEDMSLCSFLDAELLHPALSHVLPSWAACRMLAPF